MKLALVAVVIGCSLVACDAMRTPEAKTATREVVDLGVATCVAEAESLDELVLALLCKSTREIIRPLLGAKLVGLRKAGVRLERDGGAP